MATAAELGLTTPGGTDYISDGDDAISNNAERLAQMFTDLDQRANLPTRRTVANEDLNVSTVPQIIQHHTATGVKNLPPWDFDQSGSGNTFIQVMNMAGGTAYAAQVAFRYGAIPEMAWRVSRNSNGLWQPWQMVRAKNPHLDDGMYRHMDLVSRARARRGGPIGTAGLPAVAFRFDHHLDPFASKVLPLLEERGLPWAQTFNSRRVGTGDDTWGYAAVQEAALSTGGEVWNHSATHGDAETEDVARIEIADGLAELQAGMPRLAIEGWTPGTGSGPYMGAAPFKTTEQLTGTYTGQLMIRNHAFVAGYADGTYRTLDPMIQPIGAGHMTIDYSNPGQVRRAIEGLGADGLALMLHPNYLDEPGYLSLADFTAILDDIVARRDSGELAVLTYSGLWLADARSDYRDNLLAGQAAETTGSWSGSWDPSRREDRLGSVREITALIKSPSSSSVTISATAGAEQLTQRTLTVAASPDWQAVTTPITLPGDLADHLTVTITTAAGVRQRSQALAAI